MSDEQAKKQGINATCEMEGRNAAEEMSKHFSVSDELKEALSGFAASGFQKAYDLMRERNALREEVKELRAGKGPPVLGKEAEE